MRHHFCSHILKYIALFAELFPSDKEKKAASFVCVFVRLSLCVFVPFNMFN
jgi:hypothetical protein